MKKCLIYILLTFLYPSIGESQIPGLSIDADNRVTLPENSMVDLTYIDTETIGIYLDSSRSNTQLLYPNGTTKLYKDARYNVLENKLEAIINEKPFDILPGIISGFSLEDQTAIRHLVLKVNLDEDVFMECLSAGEINLLVNRTLSGVVDTGTEISTKTYYFSERPDEKIEYDEYFYTQIPGDGLKRLKLSKKNLLKLMSDREDEMEEYIRGNNLNPDNINELILIFNYYNGQ